MTILLMPKNKFTRKQATDVLGTLVDSDSIKILKNKGCVFLSEKRLADFYASDIKAIAKDYLFSQIANKLKTS